MFQEVIYADEVENITDLYATTRLSRLSFTNPYDRYEVLEDATIEISVDGENYTKVADMTGATKTHDVVMPEGTDARYVRITNVNKVNCYTRVAFMATRLSRRPSPMTASGLPWSAMRWKLPQFWMMEPSIRCWICLKSAVLLFVR